MQAPIIIIGGGYAGMLVAARLRELLPTQPLVLVDRNKEFSHRIRWHEHLVGRDIESFSYRSQAELCEYAFFQAEIAALDPTAKKISLKLIAGNQLRELSYEYLVLATGSSSFQTKHARALNLNSNATVYQSGQRLKTMNRIVVVGGGLTAIEYASEIAEYYPDKKVELIARESILPAYPTVTQNYVRQRICQLNIELHEETKIYELSENYLTTECGQNLFFDGLIWETGFYANNSQRLGEYSQNNGRIQTDGGLKLANFPEIFVVGDLAAAPMANGRYTRMSCASACLMAPFVAENIAASILKQGVHGKPGGRIFEPFYLLHCISLGRGDALLQFVTPDDEFTQNIAVDLDAVKIKQQITKACFDSVSWSPQIPIRPRWPDFAGLLQQYG